MTAILSWWAALTAREQALLSVMGAILLGVIAVYGIAAPLERYRTDAERTLTAARADAQVVEQAIQAASTLDQNGQPRQTAPTDLRLTVSRTAQARSLAVTRIQPDSSGGLNVWLAPARAADVYAWLTELKDEHGISVTRANLQVDDGADGIRSQLRLQGAS